MSPTITSPHPTFGFPTTPNHDKFEFVSGSGGVKSNLSNRSRPRLTKLRRNEMVTSKDGKSVNIDCLSFSDGDVFISSTKSGSNSSVKKATESFVFAFGNHGGSKLDERTGDGSYVTGARNAASTADQKFPFGAPVFGLRGTTVPVDTHLESGQFAFVVGEGDSVLNSNVGAKGSRRLKVHTKVNGFKKSDYIKSVSDSYVCGPNLSAPLNQQDLCKPCSQSSHHEFNDVSTANVVFGARTNVLSSINSDAQKQDSGKNMENCESPKGFRNTVPDVKFEVKLDPSHDSEKAGHTCFQFLFNSGYGSSKNRLNFVFGATQNDSNVVNSKDQRGINSSGFPEERPAFSLSDAMRRLNINEPEAKTKKTASLTSDFSPNSNVFIFGRDQKNSISEKENLTMEQKTPDVNYSSEINSKPNRNPTPMFSSFVNGIQPDRGVCRVPCVDKGEKLNMSFTNNPAGLDSLDAGCGTPNMTFAFPIYNFFPGIGKKCDSANSKSLKGNRLKKKTGKSKQRTVVQQLLGQDHVTKESSSLQNQKSSGSGSPMDFSPYQNTNACVATEADTSSGVKGIFTMNEKDASEHLEKSVDGKNDLYTTPLISAQDGLSAIRTKYKKKYKLKIGLTHASKGNNSDKENAKQDAIPRTAHEICEYWRIKGNQAYHDGKLSIAEEFYSTGINNAPHVSTLGYSMKPLLLCYSNRAATRMSLGRMREAIGDCKKATDIDPNFVKATLRAGNCYLVLGEVEDAIQCYSKCLSLGTDVYLDRRMTIDAADCLQKAKKVAEHMGQSSELLQEVNSSSTTTALKNIDEALSISPFSEILLQMKGEALRILRMYDEAIRLCDQTLDIAKKNFGFDCSDKNGKCSDVNFWRLRLQSKSYFHLGRLDLALELIESQDKMHGSSRFGILTQESSIALAATIRELLSLKKSGNEAYNSGNYTEAIEKYTSAISRSSESRPFMAICFCNRAAAYQSINQIFDAIADCSLAIALDEKYQKAISRRATLHEMIRDYKQAVCDMQRLVSLLERQSEIKSQSGSQSKSNGGNVRDIRKARLRLTALEEKAKREIPFDLYLILGIKATDAESEIKKSYRKAALRHHPDKVLVRSDIGDGGTLWKDFREKIHEDADRLFKVIGEAYAVLSDPSKRAKYDNEEEIRNIHKDSSRKSNSGCPSTSYSSSFERGNWYERQTSTSSERNSNRRHWYYSNSHSRW